MSCVYGLCKWGISRAGKPAALKNPGKSFQLRSATSGLVRVIIVLSTLAIVGMATTAYQAHAVPVGCAPAPSGQVSWWPGDRISEDIIGHSRLTLVGAAYGPGLVDYAFSFDGVDDYVASPLQPVPNLINTQFTIQFWANPGSVADRPTFGFLGSGTSNVANPIASYDGFLSIGDGTDFQVMPSLPLASPNTWTHYAILDDGSNYVLYVNGVQQYSRVIAVNPASPGSMSFTIGQSGFSDGYEGFFRGSIDEFSVYGRALSVSEIQTIIDAETFGVCKPLTVTPDSMPLVVQGHFYSLQFNAVGGTAAYSWSFASGSPPGMSLSSTGLLSGTLTSPGSFEFTVQVVDATSTVANRILVMRVKTTSGSLWIGTDNTGGALDALHVDVFGALLGTISRTEVTGVASDGHFLYTSSSIGLVTKRDPDGNPLSSFSIGACSGLCEDMAWDGSTLWRVSDGGLLQRIDPVAMQVTATIALPFRSIGVASDGVQLWVSDFTRDGRIMTFDPNLGLSTLTERFRASGFTPGGLAVDSRTGILWVGAIVGLGSQGNFVAEYSAAGAELFRLPTSGRNVDGLEFIQSNFSPIADAGPDLSGSEGSSLTFTFSCSDINTHDAWTASVDWGDGSGLQALQPVICNSGTFTAAHTYVDNGIYTLNLTIIDNGEGTGTDSAAVSVNNVPPTADAGGPYSALEGSTVSFTFSCTDPGSDTWTASVDFGDGSSANLGPVACNNGTFTTSHTYAFADSYYVTVTVLDDDVGSGTDTAAVTVGPPPTGSISGFVRNQYTGQPAADVTITILETSAVTTTSAQGEYSFTGLATGTFTVEMTLPFGYLTHDDVTKFATVQSNTNTAVNFTLYPASWSGATVPRTIGYWKNWDNHHPSSLMGTFLSQVRASSGLFEGLGVDGVKPFLTLSHKSTMERRAQAQLLASWLNVVSSQLGVDVQVDVNRVAGYQQVLSGSSTMSVDQLLSRIDQLLRNPSSLTNAQMEIIKNILDSLNNGTLFV